MSLLYIEKIPASQQEAFAKKVASIASFLGIHPDWLMQVMHAESKLKGDAANKQGKDKHLVAAGLLQFTEGSGIIKAGKVPSIKSILTLPLLAQLDLVKWYFTPYKGKMQSYYDVYAVTFFPAMIGKGDDWVLQTRTLSADTIARQNPALSKGNKQITVADFKRYVVGIVPTYVRNKIFGVFSDAVDKVEEEAEHVKEAIVSHPKTSAGIGTGILVGLCLLGWFFIRMA
ncbi:MAG: hypothetical protein JST06_08955 [Bacteroidetes bacterium]|nr:hypothetical protein [Bacteroidota bacterium]MBS1628685.1 hypothetical protein [Bacteroidota bacterium]